MEKKIVRGKVLISFTFMSRKGGRRVNYLKSWKTTLCDSSRLNSCGKTSDTEVSETSVRATFFLVAGTCIHVLRRSFDGQRFFVLLFLTYNYGFSLLQIKGSMDGYNIIFLGILARRHTPHGCIRILWLPPSRVSSRYVIISIVEDLREGSVEKRIFRDKYRDPKGFLDLVGYAGEHSTVTDITDAMSHNSLENC